MKLAGQVALITGGSRGIGRATTLAFAAEGADVAFCHLDDGAKAEETANEIRALGRRAMHRSLDVVDIAATRAFAQEAAAALGPIDILFNNAGMNIRKRFEDYTEADYDRILDVHMKGMFFMAQAVYPAMAARGRGCIINVASQRGLKGAVNSAPYCAAKAAIIGFTRALACEATAKGVRVNAVAPGPIVTDLTATMAPADRQAFIDALPVHRFGRPEEIAATALLLAGPDGGFYVGATLSPNGGDVMYGCNEDASPEAMNAVYAEDGLVRHQHHAFVHGLRDQHAVEWVSQRTRQCAGEVAVDERNRQRDETLCFDDGHKLICDACDAGQPADAELRRDLPGGGGAGEDRISLIGNRRAGRRRQRRVARDPPKQRVGFEQQVQGLSLPVEQFVLRQRLEELGADRHDASQCAKLSPGDRAIRHKLGDRLATACQDNLLPSLDACQKLREVRLCGMDGYNGHDD